MKEGWTYKKLGEVCNVVGGGTPDTKNKDYWNGNIPWATVSDMNCDVIKSTGYYITDRGLNESSSRIIKTGEIIIATRVGLGKVCKLAIDTAINQDLKGIIPKDNRILRDFIFYFFKKNSKYIVDNGIGATVKGVKIKFIEGLSFGYPPLSEQQSIVDYLDSAFAKIDAMKANAEKALNEAKALFQASLKEMLEPKDGWVTNTLKDECFKITDGTHQTPKYCQSGYIFLSSKNVTSRKIDWEDVKFIDESQHQIMHKRVAPQVGDILLAKNGTTGVAAMVDRDVIFDIYVSLALLRSKGNVTPDYLLAFVNSPIAKEQFDKRLIGMGVPNLHLGEINKVVITYPIDKEEQAKVTQRIEELDNLIIRLQENYDKISQECDALKQAILRQVFE